MHATRPNDKTIVDFPTMAEEVRYAMHFCAYAAVFAFFGWHLLECYTVAAAAVAEIHDTRGMLHCSCSSGCRDA
jgi:hypothetical protein